ncbi:MULTISPECIES: DUF4241 domain-containing protein [Asticcacaulis]|uniref:DUF4241 domain-containing protein n=1 Tax=Asticcacaulis TaxID=76890 RepID=UPI001AE6802A|nr:MULTISPECIES: DUF4241 domain-containing protein [Asticcacaulis]MBP2157642.1 hypothetical protein [Asticcacaulis solisilvae]MDR6798687.1 hypothetical protein [Asticcacaulis sp. BE141]
MKSFLMTLMAMVAPLTGHAQVAADPDILDGAFRPGFTTTLPDQQGSVGVQVVEAGRLKVTSGRIVAVDPFIYLDAEAFTFQVPPGDYPVRLAVAEVGKDHYRVALARVDFSDTPATRWEMALIPGQSLKTLKDKEVYGYGVDAGTGAFGDVDAFRWLNDRYKGATSSEYEDLSDSWISDGEVEGARHLPHLFLLMPEAGPANNIAMFSSGWGDGFYTSWVGYAADGKVTALVTDFLVIKATKS